MEFFNLKELDKKYVANSYSRFDAGIEQGKGARCKGFDGEEYIDFTSGIGVNSLGFCNDNWIAAVSAQLNKLQHTSNLFYTEPCVRTAEALCNATGMRKVFFANSGAEANEGAIKAARKYSYDKYGTERYRIISLLNSFHGRTVTTLAATGQRSFHNYYFPFTSGFNFAMPGDIDETLGLLEDDVCAVMLELVQGEGGVVPLDETYVHAVVNACKELDILVIVDEVQTGIGRTGSLFCFQQYDITPDIVTAAKGLGGGLPIGAVLFGDKAANVFKPGDHASTFGGNPIACAGAFEVLKQLNPAFLHEVRAKGDYIKKHVLAMPKVLDVDGMGLMLGIELKDDVVAIDVVKTAIEKGLLLLTAKKKVRMLPPLTITYEEIDAGLNILKSVLAQI